MFLNNLKSQSNKIFLFGAVLLFSTSFVINATNIEVKKNNYESYYECLLNSNSWSENKYFDSQCISIFITLDKDKPGSNADPDFTKWRDYYDQYSYNEYNY